MENASNALIIAGTILIALVILTIGVYLASSHSQVAETYDSTMESKEREAFNNKFEAFRDRDNITPQEVYSLVQFCKQYKEKTGIEVEIKCIGFNINSVNNTDFLEDQNKNQYIDHDATDPKNKKVKYYSFQCKENGIEYNEDTGIVKKITIERIQKTKTYNDNT